MNWLDIPACRIAQVSRIEMTSDFDLLDQNGDDLPSYKCSYMTEIALLRRRRDKKLFRPARFRPVESDSDFEYLEEV